MYFYTLLFDKKTEMFYLMTHSQHILFQLYGVRHMVKDPTDTET